MVSPRSRRTDLTAKEPRKDNLIITASQRRAASSRPERFDGQVIRARLLSLPAEGYMEPDYYLALRVAPNATAGEIKAARNDLARRHHTDVAGQSSADHDAMVRVNVAYAVLGDPMQRFEYDKRRVSAQIEALFGKSSPSDPVGAAKARSTQPTKKPMGLVMSLAENKIYELMHEDRIVDGLLMAFGAALVDKWIESA